MTAERAAQRGENQKTRHLRIRPTYIIIAAFIIFFSYKFVEKAWEAHQLSEQLAADRQQAALVQAANQQLRKNIRYYATNSYLESAARQLGFHDPGQRPVIVIPVRAPAVRPAPRVAKRHIKQAPAWQQWWDVFFGGH